MRPFRPIIALLLIPAALAQAAPPRRIYLNDALRKPAGSAETATLKGAVSTFRLITTQFGFDNDKDKADVSYVEFVFQRHVMGKLTESDLTALLSVPGSKPPDLTMPPATCPSCGINSLFDEVIDRTLFRGPDALYTPLQIEDCRTEGDWAINVTVKPVAGVGLERNVWYGIQFKPAPDEGPLLLAAPYERKWEGANAKLIVANSLIVGKPASEAWTTFQKTCDKTDEKARKRAVQGIVLIPHKVPPARAGALNADAQSAMK